MRDAAVSGLGITLLPTFMIHRELAKGTLCAIDVGADAEGADLHIAYSRERTASAKVGALIASLRRTFGDPPYWDWPEAGASGSATDHGPVDLLRAVIGDVRRVILLRTARDS